MALDGLWGSFFSHKDGHALTTRPKRFWSKVTLTAGKATEAENATAAHLEKEVNSLLAQ